MREEASTHRGPIAWMARNHVTANLLMIAFIVGGLIMSTRVKQEVFPDLDLDFIFVTVPYPGASPDEVEEGIILAIEEEVRGLDDVKEVTSVAREGVGVVWIELQLGANANKTLTDVKDAVDRIKTFPQDIERTTVSLAENQRHVITVMVHGEQTEIGLRKLAEEVREGLLAADGITQVRLAGVRRPEIAVEISQENLRRYKLTLEQVAARIRSSALDLPGGRVKASGGEVLVRTKERRYLGREYSELVVITRNDGTVVTLGEIATVRDDFEESDISAEYNGEPAVRIDVYRVGDETPSGVSQAVRGYVDELNSTLPPTVRTSVWEDQSEILRGRIQLLVKNALLGLVLVLVLLGLALDIRLAFWVTLGIPTSILGAMLFFPAAGMSINMVSLFAIIITIGIVVDDAVIVGENVYHMRTLGMSFVEASIAGARQMAIPVTFSILTNIAAFTPLLFVPGVTGKIFRVIPIAVIMTFLVSLVEALFILPAHLSARKRGEEVGWIESLNRRREWFGRIILWVRDHPFKTALEALLRWRYATLAVAAGVLALIGALVGSGRIDFAFMPKVEAERITANVNMPYGTPVEQTRPVHAQLLEAAGVAHAGWRATRRRGHRGRRRGALRRPPDQCLRLPRGRRRATDHRRGVRAPMAPPSPQHPRNRVPQLPLHHRPCDEQTHQPADLPCGNQGPGAGRLRPRRQALELRRDPRRRRRLLRWQGPARLQDQALCSGARTHRRRPGAAGASGLLRRRGSARATGS